MAAQTVVMPNKKATTGAPSDRRKPFRMIRVREVIAAIGEERAAEYIDEIPPVFATRVLSLRGFDADGMMAEALLTQPGEADAGIRKLFENPAIETVHAHNAARGCFSARIERS